MENVGTPLADQTIGLVTGALDAGSDTETVFETLQAEIGFSAEPIHTSVIMRN